MDSKKQKIVLEAVFRFNPISQGELKQLIPEYSPHQINTTLEKLYKRGFITVQSKENSEYSRIYDTDSIIINTNPFNIPDTNQSVLADEKRNETDIIAESLPDSVETEKTITLELTEEQTKLFERMRTDVSRNCGEMTKDEFINWIFREARRMTEV